MLFAIDFDGTFSRAPELFKQIIVLIQEQGHTVICVTARPSYKGGQVLQGFKAVPVIFANSSSKRLAAKRAGYSPDIWIDDKPETVGQGFVNRNGR